MRCTLQLSRSGVRSCPGACLLQAYKKVLHDITAELARHHSEHLVLLRLLASPSHAVDRPAAQTCTSVLMLAVRLTQPQHCKLTCILSLQNGFHARLAKHGEALKRRNGGPLPV